MAEKRKHRVIIEVTLNKGANEREVTKHLETFMATVEQPDWAWFRMDHIKTLQYSKVVNALKHKILSAPDAGWKPLDTVQFDTVMDIWFVPVGGKGGRIADAQFRMFETPAGKRCRIVDRFGIVITQNGEVTHYKDIGAPDVQ